MSEVLDRPVSRPVDAPVGPGGPSGTGVHPVAAFVTGLHGALDRVAGAPAWSMSPAEQREALVALAAARARVEELELQVLVSADRNAVGAEAGATSTGAWLAEATGRTRPAAFAAMHLARALEEEFEATRSALAAGEIDADRARVIVHAVDELSREHDDLPAGTREAAEAHMLALAGRFDAAMLRRLGKRLFEVVCPEAADADEGEKLAREEERARRTAYVSMRENGDGTSEGRFRLPALHAALLEKVLSELTSPDRLGAGRLDPETGRVRPRSVLWGQGFIDLLEHHLDLASLPGSQGSPFTLVVTIGLDALVDRLGVAAVESGARISATEARRLACTAGIIPMVLGGDSMPLDLGRERRLFTRYQRLALARIHGGCAAVNCDRPPWMTEAHHRHPWAGGGRTDLADGLPLCRPHHHMADHPQAWTMTQLPSGGVRFSRRT